MKLTIDRDALLSAAANGAGALAGRTTIPILEMVRLEARPGEPFGLTVTGTDLTRQAVSARAAAVDAPGVAVVAGKRLADLVKALPAGGQVRLQVEDGRLTVACGRSRYRLPTLPPADYPVFPSPDGAVHRASLDAKATAALAVMMARTAFCMSTEVTRYYLCALYLHTVVRDGAPWLRLTATDGGRLGMAEGVCPEGWRDAPGLLIPRESVADLSRAVERAKGGGEIWTDGNLFGFEAETAEGRDLVSTKRVDGSFPDYMRVIPASRPDRGLALDVESLSGALRRAGVMSDEKSRMVSLAISPEGVRLTARGLDGAEGCEEIEADWAGDALTLAFNGRFLLDQAGLMTGERLAVELGGQGDPARFYDPLAPDAATWVLMPLRS